MGAWRVWEGEEHSSGLNNMGKGGKKTCPGDCKRFESSSNSWSRKGFPKKKKKKRKGFPIWRWPLWVWITRMILLSRGSKRSLLICLVPLWVQFAFRTSTDLKNLLQNTMPVCFQREGLPLVHLFSKGDDLCGTWLYVGFWAYTPF